MKRASLLAMIIAVAACMSSCAHRMHANLMDKSAKANMPAAPAAAPKPGTDGTYTPFTKLKRQQLENSNIDMTQLQFYVDQKIILRRMTGTDRAVVKGGTIVKESDRKADELVIPEYTPVICDRVSGDTLMMSFETANNDIPFGAINGSSVYSVLGTNWINGSADVTYNGQTYRIICGSCGNIAEVQLLVKESNVDKPSTANKTITGRKLYK